LIEFRHYDVELFVKQCAILLSATPLFILQHTDMYSRSTLRFCRIIPSSPKRSTSIVRGFRTTRQPPPSEQKKGGSTHPYADAEYGQETHPGAPKTPQDAVPSSGDEHIPDEPQPTKSGKEPQRGVGKGVKACYPIHNLKYPLTFHCAGAPED
jgi:hypothetical protein